MSKIISNIISNISNLLSNFIKWVRVGYNIIYVLLLLVIVYLLNPILLCRPCLLQLIAFFSLYFIITVSLNFQYGFGGVPNFGMVLPVAAGAFVSGALAGRIAMWYYGVGEGLDFIDDNNTVTYQINAHLANDPLGGIMIFVIILVIAIVIAFGLGYVASRPAIRLRADYLIIVLISMGEAIRIIGRNYPRLVGATMMVSVPDILLWLGDWRSTFYTLLFIVAALLLFAMVEKMTTSPYGRVLKAVRENEVTAETLGKDVIAIKTMTLVIGSGIAAVAGVLWSFYLKVVDASGYLRLDFTFWPWLMMMIGGMGNNRGAVAGAGGVVVFRRLLIFYKHDIAGFFPFSVVWLEQLLLGIALLLFIMFRPQGLIPEEPTKLRGINREEYEVIRNRVRSKGSD
ncbi:MAG: branched-chain amino acid ABC transporter permease [Candidatus Hodarchaeota archaeon]